MSKYAKYIYMFVCVCISAEKSLKEQYFLIMFLLNIYYNYVLSVHNEYALNVVHVCQSLCILGLYCSDF